MSSPTARERVLAVYPGARAAFVSRISGEPLPKPISIIIETEDGWMAISDGWTGDEAWENAAARDDLDRLPPERIPK